MSEDDKTILLRLLHGQFRILELDHILKCLNQRKSGKKQDKKDRIQLYIDEHGVSDLLSIPLVISNISQSRESGRLKETELNKIKKHRMLEENKRKQKALEQQRQASSRNSYMEYLNNISDYEIYNTQNRHSNSTRPSTVEDFFEGRSLNMSSANEMIIIDSEFPVIKWHGVECSTYNINWMIQPFYEQLRVIYSSIIDGGSRAVTFQFSLSSGEYSDLRIKSRSIVFVMTHLHAAFLSVQNTLDGVKYRCLVEYPWAFKYCINGNEISYKSKGIKEVPGSSSVINLSNHCKLGINTLSFPFNGFSKLASSILFARPVSIQEITDSVILRKTPSTQKLDFVKSLISKHNDEDVQFGDFNVSLNDPISLTRIQIPVLSSTCNHLQPFDLINFLIAQLQAPLFRCPVCHTSIGSLKLTITHFNIPPSLKNDLTRFPLSKYFKSDPIPTISVDSWFVAVLDSCSEYIGPALSFRPLQIDEITIQLDGSWIVKSTSCLSDSDKDSFATDSAVMHNKNGSVDDDCGDEVILINATSNTVINRQSVLNEDEDGVIIIN
eukprot:NODE_332_length_10744_cov_0.374072.p2 type:complete len:552 gc:universal NODE_332_length_10744_cov_0.374072:2189-3844(+)